MFPWARQWSPAWFCPAAARPASFPLLNRYHLEEDGNTGTGNSWTPLTSNPTQTFTAKATYALQGIDLFMQSDCTMSPGCSDCPNGCVGTVFVQISLGNSPVAAGNQFVSFPDTGGEGWTNIPVVNLTGSGPPMIKKGKTYTIMAYQVNGDETLDWGKGSSYLYQLYATNTVTTSYGALDVPANYPTNSVAYWTTPDDITSPGPHTFTAEFVSMSGFFENEGSNLFFNLPTNLTISASFTLESTGSNAPTGYPSYQLLNGSGGMGALNGLNFPVITNVLPILTTGTNAAALSAAQSWLNILGTNGVVPIGGEFVFVITNALYQGSNGLVVTVDFSGTYDFDTGEADWTSVGWRSFFPPIAPTLFAPAIAAGKVSFLFQTLFEQTYSIQTADSLQATNWQVLTNVNGDGSVQQISDAVSNAPLRFYRISSP